MKPIFLLLSFALISLVVQAQDGIEQLKTQAQSCADAFVKKDYQTMTNYTHPLIIEIMGGRKSAVSLMEKSVTAQLEKGVSLAGISIEEPGEIRKIGKWQTSLIKENVVLKVPEGTVDLASYLLAISEDKGKSWFFIDLGQITPEILSEIAPEIAAGVKIPAQTDPILRKK